MRYHNFQFPSTPFQTYMVAQCPRLSVEFWMDRQWLNSCREPRKITKCHWNHENITINQRDITTSSFRRHHSRPAGLPKSTKVTWCRQCHNSSGWPIKLRNYRWNHENITIHQRDIQPPVSFNAVPGVHVHQAKFASPTPPFRQELQKTLK